MSVHEITHPIWGSNLGNQVSTNNIYDPGDDGSGYRTKKVLGWFGGEKMKRVYVHANLVPPTDNDSAWRYFRHRCGLLKITMTSLKKNLLFVVFLDGHVTSNFNSDEMSFRFAPKELNENGGNPIAEIWFSGIGERRGPFHSYETQRIICTFANEEQMNQYLDVTNRRTSKAIVYKGMRYAPTSSGQYQSDDGSILPYLVLAYMMLSPDQQQVFADQNPDLKETLSDTFFAGGESGGGGVTGSSDPNEAAQDDATHENDGESEGSDGESSSDSDEGSSASGDSCSSDGGSSD